MRKKKPVFPTKQKRETKLMAFVFGEHISESKYEAKAKSLYPEMVKRLGTKNIYISYSHNWSEPPKGPGIAKMRNTQETDSMIPVTIIYFNTEEHDPNLVR